MEPSSGARQAEATAKDAGSSVAANVTGTGLRAVAALIASRILGASGFGTYTLARTITTVLGTAASMGLSPGALPFLARARHTRDAAALRAVVRSCWLIAGGAGLAVSLALWAATPWLARSVFEDPLLVDVLGPLSAYVLLASLATVSLTVIQGFMRIRTQAWLDRVLIVAVMVVGLAVSWRADLGVPGVIVATLLGPAVVLGVALVLVRRLLPGVVHPGAPTAPLPTRALVSASWPLMGASMFALVTVWMDILLMGVFRPSHEVGIYGVCARLAPTVVLVHEAISPTFSARLAGLHVTGDWTGIERLYQLTGRWSLWTALSLGCAVALWAEPVLALFGPEFVAGAGALVLLVLGRAVLASAGMTGRLLVLTGRARANLWCMAAVLVLNAGLDVVWIPRHGALGAATATCLSLSLGKLLQVSLVWSAYGILPWTARSLVAVLGTAGLAALVWPWRAGLDLPLGWLLPLALYLSACALLFALLGMGVEERQALAALRRRLRG